MTDPDSLKRSVTQDLLDNVLAMRQGMAELQDSREHLEAATADLVRKNKTNKILATIALLGLFASGILIAMVAIAMFHQHDINDRQDCLNAANQDRAKASVTFFEREVTKLYAQANGFEELLQASQTGDKAKSLEGFTKFLHATEHAADANANVLEGLGVKVTVDKATGDVTFTDGTPPKVRNC